MSSIYFCLQLKNLFNLLISIILVCLILAVALIWNSLHDLQTTLPKPDLSLTDSIINQTAQVGDELLLQASISALNLKVAQTELELLDIKQRLASNSSIKQITPTVAFSKETLYLGSASTQSREWTATSLEIGINSAHYPSDVSVKLEVAMSIIGGEAWVRLKNKTTGAVIPLSEISHNTSVTTWKLSPGFKLHPGGYTYVLEARSTSGEVANISGARLIVE